MSIRAFLDPSGAELTDSHLAYLKNVKQNNYVLMDPVPIHIRQLFCDGYLDVISGRVVVTCKGDNLLAIGARVEKMIWPQ